VYSPNREILAEYCLLPARTSIRQQGFEVNSKLRSLTIDDTVWSFCLSTINRQMTRSF
jgi:hypothetical protein